MKTKKILMLGISICLVLFGCGNQTKEKEPEISALQGSYTIDVNSYAELSGDADYVFVGKVTDELGVDYKWPVMIENEDGTPKEVTTPYTNYSVKVVENLKGELSQEATITITKEGGITKDGAFCMLAENDILPVSDSTYIFFIYAQDDGSNLASGPNSTIPIENNGNSEFSTRTIQESNENVLEEVKEGVVNQIISERDRAISKDDVSVQN